MVSAPKLAAARARPRRSSWRPSHRTNRRRAGATRSGQRRRPHDGPCGGGGDHRRQARPRPLEQVLYGEFDGRRRKRVLVKLIRE